MGVQVLKLIFMCPPVHTVYEESFLLQFHWKHEGTESRVCSVKLDFKVQFKLRAVQIRQILWASTNSEVETHFTNCILKRM